MGSDGCGRRLLAARDDPRALVDGAGGDLGEWAESVEIRPVSRAVSTVRNDGPGLVRPVDPAEGMLF